MSFSDNLKRLDEMVIRLESEPLPLEEALSLFEEGVALVRESEALLRDAEQKVTILTDEGDALFDDAPEDDGGGAPGDADDDERIYF